MGNENWNFSDAINFFLGAAKPDDHNHLEIKQMEEHEVHQ